MRMPGCRPALLISGSSLGTPYYGDGRRVEAWLPGAGPGSTSCRLPDLPHSRYKHTSTGTTLCGGGDNWDTRSSCTRLDTVTGTWVTSHRTAQPRVSHSSWDGPAGLVLIGGTWSTNSTELLRETLHTV